MSKADGVERCAFLCMTTQVTLRFALCISVQIFEGNTHYDTPELRHFEETVAQYVRLYPERWSPAGIGMRVEILGCDLPGRAFCCFSYDGGSLFI